MNVVFVSAGSSPVWIRTNGTARSNPPRSGRRVEKILSETQYCRCQTHRSCPLADTHMPACPLSYCNHEYARLCFIHWLEFVSLNLFFYWFFSFLLSLSLKSGNLSIFPLFLSHTHKHTQCDTLPVCDSSQTLSSSSLSSGFPASPRDFRE